MFTLKGAGMKSIKLVLVALLFYQGIMGFEDHNVAKMPKKKDIVEKLFAQVPASSSFIEIEVTALDWVLCGVMLLSCAGLAYLDCMPIPRKPWNECSPAEKLRLTFALLNRRGRLGGHIGLRNTL